MNTRKITLAEFRAVFPEFADIADHTARCISERDKGRNVAGATVYDEELLATAAHIHAMEAFLWEQRADRGPSECGAKRGYRRWDKYETRSAFAEFAAHAKKRGVPLTEIGSLEYWQRSIKYLSDNNPAAGYI